MVILTDSIKRGIVTALGELSLKQYDEVESSLKYIYGLIESAKPIVENPKKTDNT